MDWRMPRAYTVAPRRVRRLDGLASNGTTETYSPPPTPQPAGEAVPAKSGAVVWLPIAPVRKPQPTPIPTPAAPGYMVKVEYIGEKIDPVGAAKTYFDVAKFGSKSRVAQAGAAAVRVIATPSEWARLEAAASWFRSTGRFIPSWATGPLRTIAPVAKGVVSVIGSTPVTLASAALVAYQRNEAMNNWLQAKRDMLLRWKDYYQLAATGKAQQDRVMKQWFESKKRLDQLQARIEMWHNDIKRTQSKIAYFESLRERVPGKSLRYKDAEVLRNLREELVGLLDTWSGFVREAQRL